MIYVKYYDQVRISTIKHNQKLMKVIKKMHEDEENLREFKWKFRAGNQRITNFETFQWK